jgi:hypothetical protein
MQTTLPKPPKSLAPMRLTRSASPPSLPNIRPPRWSTSIGRGSEVLKPRRKCGGEIQAASDSALLNAASIFREDRQERAQKAAQDRCRYVKQMTTRQTWGTTRRTTAYQPQQTPGNETHHGHNSNYALNRDRKTRFARIRRSYGEQGAAIVLARHLLNSHEHHGGEFVDMSIGIGVSSEFHALLEAAT